ncbi:MAG: ferritin family protein [Candidatus Krumholzibacteria bacterium]|jgi:rubrerythrin|nr:ferritin family protein [Candidatus Krumholzibacteria bacterium]
MSDFNTIEAALNYAIAMEQAAVDLYTEFAERAQTEAMKEAFLAIAQEERGHKAKLAAAKSGARPLAGASETVQDLKIADYTSDVDLAKNPSYADILVFAMQQEKHAFRLYTDLAARTDDQALKQLFLALAQDEAKHKLRFEVEYDQQVLSEN